MPEKKKSLDRKLAALQANPDAKVFIIADAKDADLAWGCASPGEPWPREKRRYRSMSEYLGQMREIVRRNLVDILLASPATQSQLVGIEGVYNRSSVTPAVRANDSTDIWRGRGATYRDEPSQPFAACQPGELRTAGLDLGLYSLTFNNRIRSDLETLEAFHHFRREARKLKFRYFAEFFPPNIRDCGIPKAAIPAFVNDSITRTLAGVPIDSRPLFLKMPYWGPRALEELRGYDPSVIIGILGGGSGTTHDAFKLLADAKRYGARCALFGRKIKDAEDPLAFLISLRAVADGELSSPEAVRLYHDGLARSGLRPKRPLNEDLKITFDDLTYTRL